MTERGTSEEFARWVEPHLTMLALYAARRVGPRDRDAVVTESLVRAWQRRSSYDESRISPAAWLIGVLAERCRHHRPHDLPDAVVELVDRPVDPATVRDADLERALQTLTPEQQRAVDLHYFVGLDAATVAEVVGGTPEAVTTTLSHARSRVRGVLGVLGALGDDADDHVERRLTAEGRHWQDDQPPAPDISLQRLDRAAPSRFSWKAALAVAAAVAIAGGGAVVVVRGLGGDGTAPRAAGPSPTAQAQPDPKQIVPWRALDAGHPSFKADQSGVTVTPYDDVSVSGTISGTVHPGDTLTFLAGLTAPLVVSLHPCPDYTISFGTQTVTRRLNCDQVPYFASVVRANGTITAFRPVIPGGNVVFFRMRVTVPDEPGQQSVRWTLDGPDQPPGFSGTVDVTSPGEG
jgi:RNA polymerase sigma factor (sigma-70 family)